MIKREFRDRRVGRVSLAPGELIGGFLNRFLLDRWADFISRTAREKLPRLCTANFESSVRIGVVARVTTFYVMFINLRYIFCAFFCRVACTLHKNSSAFLKEKRNCQLLINIRCQSIEKVKRPTT